MSGQMIGIKLADRSFFPIVSEDEPGRRRVVLSTARDHQDRVDIVLYRAVSAPSGTHQRIGDLSLFNLPDRGAGENEFELVVGIDETGRVRASVTDLDSGDSRDLAADLDDLPFDLDEVEQDEPTGVVQPRPSSPRRRGIPVILMVLLLLALIGFAAWFFLLRDRESAAPSAAAQTRREETATSQPATPEAATPEAATPEPEAVERDPSPAEVPPEDVSVEDDPQPPLREEAPEPAGTTVEVPYEIIRGDTLWDISIHFYGTPWKFRDIAERNEINNPDLIYADDDIVIPADP